MKNNFKKVSKRFFLIALFLNLSYRINSFEPVIPYKVQLCVLATAGIAQYFNLKEGFANLMMAGSYMTLTWLGYKLYLKRKNISEKKS